MEGVFFVLLIIFGAAAATVRQSSKLKGYLGEFLVHRTLEKSLSRPHYTILRDVTLKTRKGTTQIDHIVVSPYGIFVIETRHMSGWIFGSEHDAQWTRSFLRSKQRFQNPLRQNHGHIKALEELLRLDSSKFHSLVVFTGSAGFKTSMPVNVTKPGGLLPFIQVRTLPLIDYDDAVGLAAVIESIRMAPGRETNAAHIESLRTRNQSMMGAVDEARGLMRQTTRTLRGVKMSVGIVLTGIFLLIGSMVLKNVSSVISGPTTASSSLAVQPKKINDHLAWEASLMCGYSSDTTRCTCYEPKGGKVEMEIGVCRALVDKNDVFVQ
jgi:restriction system protein